MFRTVARVLCGLIVVSTLTLGCDLLTTPDDVDGNTVPPGHTRVSFTMPESTGSTMAANTLLYADVSGELASLEHAQLVAGANSIDLPKEGVYLLGFAEQGTQGSVRTAGLGGAITLIGTIELTSTGLNTIPLSGTAADGVDLGQLEESGNGVSSDAGAGELAAGTGHSQETLESFGDFDGTVLKFINPDIDRNGILDAEENLPWTLFAILYFDFNPGDFSFDPPTVNNAVALSEFAVQYAFAVGRDFGYPHHSSDPGVYDDVTLVGDGGTTMVSHWMSVDTWHRTGEIASSPYFQPADDLDHPVNDDFTVTFGTSAEYRIEGVQFTNPTEDVSFFVFPLVEVTRDESGRITGASWTWMKRQGGVIATATAEEVLAITTGMHLSWERAGDPGNPITASPEGFGLSYHQPGTIDLTGPDYDDLTITNTDGFFVDIGDIADNYYKFNFAGAYTTLE